MPDETKEQLDYGVSTTKRCTVLAVEEMLGMATPVLDYGRIQLVDYMGGDHAIINAATNYYGLGVVDHPDPEDFMLWLRQQGIRKPFRFAEIKVNMAMPISAALIIVPFEEASVNEYSGRYSVMVDDCYNPFPSGSDAAKKVEALFAKSRERYHKFIAEDTDLARELARIVLPTANYTQCYWKVNLESLFTFFKENPDPPQHLAPYIDRLRYIAKNLAPAAYEAFQAIDENKETIRLRMNVDDGIIAQRERWLRIPYCLNETRRLTVPAAEEQMFKIQPVLDHGFVGLIDYMGTDESIVQAARVSYGRGTKKTSEDRGLIRYLERHLHTTPSEMIELAFIAKLPLFVERQLVRHRMVDKVGFLDGFVLEPDMYIPEKEELRRQSATNKQGRGTELEELLKDQIRESIEETEREYKEVYKDLDRGGHIDNDRLRNLRPVGSFTSWCIKSDIKNLFHFLGLRLDAHAQKESRVYAEAMAQITKAVAPIAYEAFEDYRVHGLRLSSLEVDAIKKIIAGNDRKTVLGGIENKREREELETKLKRLVE